jgi:glutathione S-transferase
MPVLYSSKSSPFGRKTRMVVDILGIADKITLQHVDTQNPNDPIRTINPLGKIPALVPDGEPAIFDSREIIEYLDVTYGNGEIVPTDPKVRFRVLTLAALADGVMEALLLIVYEGRYRPPELKGEVWLERQYDKVRRGLAAATERLDEYKAPNIAALTLACTLGYIDFRKQLDWRSEFPALVAWLDAFAAEVPAFARTEPTDT